MTNVSNESRELVISRLFDAPREAIYNAWVTPELLMQWWTPKPWSTTQATIEPMAGGAFNTTHTDPEGNEHPDEGVFLEVVPNERIVFTDAFSKGWQPKPDPFMLAIVTLEDEEGKTRYTATVRHWTAEAKERHEAMGFHEGWGQALNQLAQLVEK